MSARPAKQPPEYAKLSDIKTPAEGLPGLAYSNCLLPRFLPHFLDPLPRFQIEDFL